MSIYMLKKYNFNFNDKMMMLSVRSLVFVELSKKVFQIDWHKLLYILFVLILTMDPEHQKSQLQINQDIICSLSNKERYFIVHPYTKEELENIDPKTTNTDPIVLVYKDDDNTKIIDLVKKYDKLVEKTHKLPNATLSFALESGHIQEKDETIGEIKRKLRRSNLDGLELYSEKNHSECALYNLNKAEELFNHNAIEVPFTIEGVGYSNYLKVKPEDNFKARNDIEKQIISMIQLEFGIIVDPKSLSTMVLSAGKTEDLKKTNITEMNQNDKIIISLKGIELTKPKEMKNHLVIKGQKFKGVNVEYESIKNKKIRDLLKDLDASQEWETYGLMIDDFVLKNYETIDSVKEVKALFEASAGISKHVVGIVLKESHIFEKEQGKIAEKGKFDLEKHFYKEPKNQEYREKCDLLIRERAEKAPKLEFKDVENVTPIFRYTTQIKVFGSHDKTKASSIYRNLNFFLRNQNFAQAARENYQTMWEYQFNNDLLNQLNKLPSVTNTVLWRGVDYLPDHFVGEKVLYKQFNSTSMKKDTATTFACGAIFKITKSFSGKLIKDYSYYSTESEVLFPPYCQFLITKVDEILLEKKNIKGKYIEMEEIEKEPLPKNEVNYILWVDDKTIEGKNIWSSFANIRKSTVMKQLLSTAELEEWLINYKDLLSDPEIKVSMITNMTRKEGGKLNEIAGVEGIKLFRSYLPNSNVFLYIGNKKLAIEKLSKYGEYSESQILQISSAPSKLKDFLRRNGEIQ